MFPAGFTWLGYPFLECACVGYHSGGRAGFHLYGLAVYGDIDRAGLGMVAKGRSCLALGGMGWYRPSSTGIDEVSVGWAGLGVSRLVLARL